MGDNSKDNKGLVKPTGAPDFKKMREQNTFLVKTPVSDSALLKSPENFRTSLQVLLMFDITGSMFEYFDLVRKKLQEIISAVKKETPQAEFAVFAYRNHGDEDTYKQIYYTCSFTSNQEKLFSYLLTIKKGGGGHDALTCMEDCLMEANKLHWQSRIPKAIVIIGDMPPHGVVDAISHCYNGIDYRKEVAILSLKGIKFYTVYADSQSSKSHRIRNFYQTLAEENSGKFLEIDQIDVLVNLLIGICMKETGNLDKFIKELEKNKNISSQQKKTVLMLKG